MKDVLAGVVFLGCLLIIPMALVALVGPFPLLLIAISGAASGVSYWWISKNQR